MTSYLHSSSPPPADKFVSILDQASVWSARFAWSLLDHLHLIPNQRVLDLGCGAGFPLLELAQMHDTDSVFVGIDCWHEALSRARHKQRESRIEGAHLAQGDVHRLPFGDHQFDLIVCNVGINNFADPNQVFLECGRVAKPGARIALTTNPRGHVREFYEAFREVLARREDREALARLNAEESHRWTKRQIVDGWEDAGFQLKREIEDRFELRFATGTAFFHACLTRYGFLDGWRSVVDRQREEAVFQELEQQLNEQASRLGELRFSVPMLFLEGRREG